MTSSMLDLSSFELPDFLDTPESTPEPVQEPRLEEASQPPPVVQEIPKPAPAPVSPPPVAPVGEVVDVDLPSEPSTLSDSMLSGDLRSAIAAMSQDSEQVELTDEDGFVLGDLAQLETASTIFDDIAYLHDLIEWGKIFIGQGKVKIRLPWEGMGFSKEAIVALQKADASQTTITLFDAVRKAGNELKGMRTDLYELYATRYGNHWVTVAERYGAACLKLSKMLDRAAELRRHINDCYEDAKQDSLVSIAEIMKTTTDLSDAQIARKIREDYLPRFPSQAQMNRSFVIRIEKPRIRPALKRRLEGNLESAELMAQIARANRNTEEERAIARINRMSERIVLEAKAQAVSSFSKKVMQKIADTLNKLNSDKVKPGNLTKAMQESVMQALEDLRIMTEQPWATSFGEAVNQVQTIAELAQDEDVDGEELRGQIDTLLGAFTQQYNFEFAPATTGHRSAPSIDIQFDDEDS